MRKKDNDEQPLIEQVIETKVSMPMSFSLQEGIIIQEVDDSEKAQPPSSSKHMEEIPTKGVEYVEEDLMEPESIEG